MKKDEMILVHQVLINVKRLFEYAGMSNEYFEAYDEFNVLPTHIHKNIYEHKKAIIMLCKGVIDIFKHKKETEITLKMLYE